MTIWSGDARINRYLAACGLGSRRAVETLITAGRVRVNGRVVSELHERVKAGDRVECDGRHVVPPVESITIALHKPSGFETSHKPRGGRPSIFRLLPDELGQLRYAGRLDAESRGLVLLSNDGSFVQAVTHPSHELTKTYLVRLRGSFNPEELTATFVEGIRSEGELLRALRAHFRNDGALELELGEGRNRHIRRMARALGLYVEDLFRTRIGSYDLEVLGPKPGAFVRIEPALVFASRSASDEN